MNQKRLLFITLVGFALLLAVRPVHAAGGVRATLTASGSSELTVGDPVQLTLKVTHPAGQQVIIPRLEQSWGSFEVQEQSQTETTANDDGTETTRQTLTVTLFEPGAFETPELPLTLSNGGGEISEVLVAPLLLTVLPTLAEGDTTLNDIRPQVGMDVPALWPMVVAGLLAVAAVAGGGWWLYRRRQGTGLFGAAVDNRPPYQVARDELERIRALGLPENGYFKEHYTLVTDTLRTYLEKQIGVNAFDRTTSELKLELRYSILPAEHTRPFIDLFSDADFVKFAKLIPEVGESYQLIDQARNLVDLTRPATEPEDTPQHPVNPGKFHRPVEVTQ